MARTDQAAPAPATTEDLPRVEPEPRDDLVVVDERDEVVTLVSPSSRRAVDLQLVGLPAVRIGPENLEHVLSQPGCVVVDVLASGDWAVRVRTALRTRVADVVLLLDEGMAIGATAADEAGGPGLRVVRAPVHAGDVAAAVASLRAAADRAAAAAPPATPETAAPSSAGRGRSARSGRVVRGAFLAAEPVLPYPPVPPIPAGGAPGPAAPTADDDGDWAAAVTPTVATSPLVARVTDLRTATAISQPPAPLDRGAEARPEAGRDVSGEADRPPGLLARATTVLTKPVIRLSKTHPPAGDPAVVVHVDADRRDGTNPPAAEGGLAQVPVVGAGPEVPAAVSAQEAAPTPVPAPSGAGVGVGSELVRADWEELAGALLDHVADAATWREIAQQIVQDVAAWTEADTALLVREPDGTWPPVAGVGLRQLEFSLVVPDTHPAVLLVSETDPVVVVEDTDEVRGAIANMPLASRRSVLIGRLPRVDALVVAGTSARTLGSEDVRRVGVVLGHLAVPLAQALERRAVAEALQRFL